jgi:hypothetical protein
MCMAARGRKPSVEELLQRKPSVALVGKGHGGKGGAAGWQVNERDGRSFQQSPPDSRCGRAVESDGA